MEPQTPRLKTQIKQRNLYDPRERERILQQYGGIFKNSITEFASKVIKKHKAQINHSA